MRLTIKDKQPKLAKVARNSTSQEETSIDLLKSAARGCCGTDPGKKHKLLLARNESEKNMQKLVKFDCENLYSRICRGGE